jgi:hypothetical protein
MGLKDDLETIKNLPKGASTVPDHGPKILFNNALQHLETAKGLFERCVIQLPQEHIMIPSITNAKLDIDDIFDRIRYVSRIARFDREDI